MSSTLLPPPREQLCNRSCSNKTHTHTFPCRFLDLGLTFLLASAYCTRARLSFPVVYVGVVEYAPASPYTYSSSTHRFPYESTPIETMPLSATSTELGLGWGLGLGLDSLSHSSSHTLSFFSPPSFHTLFLSPVFTSVWWSA